MAFHFQRPEGFEYKAGHFIDLTVNGNVHAFSLTSAPHQKDLMIATRMRDSQFKNDLKALEPGGEVEITEAMGSFTLHNDVSKTAVFLIGGIGITPVHSMILDATQRKLEHKMVLFYSNHTREDAAFFEELTELAKQNPNFTFIPTMTKPEEAAEKWEGEIGYITPKMVQKYVPDIKAAVWYMSGPAAMVKAMREVITTLGVDEDFIRSEEFSGY